MIAYGVTSVRNMGGRLEGQSAHADRSDFTGDASPRCFYAGRILEGTRGRIEDWGFVHPTTEEETLFASLVGTTNPSTPIGE